MGRTDRRIAVELSSGTCKVVEVANRTIRVLERFDFPPGDSTGLVAGLRRLFSKRRFSSRHVRVVDWTLSAQHQLLSLPSMSDSELRVVAAREARAALARPGTNMVVTFTPADDRVVGGVKKRQVNAAAAPRAEIDDVMAALAEAGLVVDAVTTMAGALVAADHARHPPGPPQTCAYVAIGADRSTLAIVRGAALLFSRELAWGYRETRADDEGRELKRGELAAKLGLELKRSILYFRQTTHEDVSQIALCGDRPELRGLTAPLIELLDLEVETLDTFEGINVSVPPQQAEALREQAAGLRAALAVAAAPQLPIDLVPQEVRARRREARARLRAALATAAAFGLLAVGHWREASDLAAAERRVTQIRSEAAGLAPQVVTLDVAQTAERLEQARGAALMAFETGGPRVARLLEGLAAAAPPEVVLQSLKLESDGASWRATLIGAAFAADPAAAQMAFNRFTRALQQVPSVSAIGSSPALRIVGAGAPVAKPASGTEAGQPESPVPAVTLTPPPGTSALEFQVDVVVPK